MSIRNSPNDKPITALEVGMAEARALDISGMSKTERKKLYKKASCCFFTALVVFIFVCILSISRLHYYEIGFKRKRTSGIVDRSKVYTAGRYWLGLNGVFVKYPANAIDEFLVDLSAWTRATVDSSSSDDAGIDGGINADAGTAVLIDLGFQYQLIPNKLAELYSKVGTNFEGYVKNIAINTIKNNATLFSSDEFIKSRVIVEKAFKEALSSALEEEANCKLVGLQMRHISFPETFMERKLQASIQELKNQAEEYRKTASISRVETRRQAREKENDAFEIEQTAIAQAELVKQKALNEAKRLKEASRSDGLKLITDNIGVTSTKHVVSLDYMISLMNAAPTETYVNFDSIVKNLN